MTDLNRDYKNLKLQYRKIFIESANKFQKEFYKMNKNEILKYIDNYKKSVIKNLIIKIKQQRAQSKCQGCGSCCRFAVSEFSSKELKTKAQNGDKFAKEFIETFIQYETTDEACKINPEYLKFLEASNVQDVYFYHCPRITSDNRCPIYENRPQICRDFPDNPIAFLPPSCSFSSWKDTTINTFLQLRAESEILEYYTLKN